MNKYIPKSTVGFIKGLRCCLDQVDYLNITGGRKDRRPNFKRQEIFNLRLCGIVHSFRSELSILSVKL